MRFSSGIDRHAPLEKLIFRGMVKNIRAADTQRPSDRQIEASWDPKRFTQTRFAPRMSYFGPAEGQLLDRNQATGPMEARNGRESVRRAYVFDHRHENYY